MKETGALYGNYRAVNEKQVQAQPRNWCRDNIMQCVPN